MAENIPKKPIPTLYGSEEDLGVRYKDVDYPYVPGKGFIKPLPEFEGFPKSSQEGTDILTESIRSGAFKAPAAIKTDKGYEFYNIPPSRPPEGAKGPNYTDRSGFEQQVFKKLDGNPFTTDIMAEVNKTYTQSFPDIYNRFFRGKVTWADQGKMTKDQIEEANVLRNRYRAYLHDRITSTLKAKQNDYTMMMQRFDHEAAVVKANKERLRKEQAAMRKAPEKPKEDEYKINQALDDWRANYKTRLDQLKEDYGDFNPISGLWIPNRQTYEEYKKKRQALIDEFEKGQKSIFEGKIPKRMGGAIAGERMKGDYVGSLIKQLTIGY